MIPPKKHGPLSGWGRAPVALCDLYRPEKKRELQALLQGISGPMIARGLGRAYGDAALQPAATIGMERLDHCMHFDRDSGVLRAQAGLSLSEIMRIFIPRGFLPPVIPGTQHVTLGGAFACNVHGKNHFRRGDFAEHVQSIRLMLPSGESVECSPSRHAEIFWATAGGMGMTGIIEEVALRLMPIASASLATLSYKVHSIEDMVAAFEHYRETSEYMVGWIDHMAMGARLGQGVFEAALHAPADGRSAPCETYSPAKSRLCVPFVFPSFTLNRHSMALYNRYRFRHADDTRRQSLAGLGGFFHPLDSIAHWNRLYGRRGFLQYQCLVPESAGVAGHLRQLLAFLQERRLFSYLAVIKYHRTGVGYLTFPLQGYSVALDFPNTAHVNAHLPLLNEWVAKIGGRVYLAKDATLEAAHFRQMYGDKAREWEQLVRDLDPGHRFSSLMAERLQWKAAS